MNKLKQILDAMKLHTAETHPLVETERAMEMIEAELAQKPIQEPLTAAQIVEAVFKWEATPGASYADLHAFLEAANDIKEQS